MHVSRLRFARPCADARRTDVPLLPRFIAEALQAPMPILVGLHTDNIGGALASHAGSAGVADELSVRALQLPPCSVAQRSAAHACLHMHTRSSVLLTWTVIV
jgi:hypothetical protein